MSATPARAIAPPAAVSGEGTSPSDPTDEGGHRRHGVERARRGGHLDARDGVGPGQEAQRRGAEGEEADGEQRGGRGRAEVRAEAGRQRQRRRGAEAHRPQTTQPPQTTPVQPPPRLTLAVLNGTTITGLARAVADELTSLGYDEPNVVTNDTTNQARAVTAVYYEVGHRDDALGVAACLKLSSSRVHPMDQAERALADRAAVAVFVGADRAR